MSAKKHIYRVQVAWTGNLGSGTETYRSYARDHVIRAAEKPPIDGSSDPAFRGNPRRWNPEELLVAAVSACHKLWYLHLCATSGISVVSYEDQAEGCMTEAEDGGGRFTEATLSPRIVIRAGDDLDRAVALHHEAHAKCFIANSVNFPIRCLPQVAAAAGQAHHDAAAETH
jgi:organic hydroperoxide reductase OsmC/OhrA